jgi:hypothetical protein
VEHAGVGAHGSESVNVAVFPSDAGGCAHYRLELPANALADLGADVRIERERTRTFMDWGGYKKVHGSSPDFDVAVFGRVMTLHRYSIMRAFQRAGIAVVVEIDDDFDAIHRLNSGWYASQPDWMLREEYEEHREKEQLRAWQEHRKKDPLIVTHTTEAWGQEWVRVAGVPSDSGRHWLHRACAAADLVTCTTPALARRYGAHGRVKVIPNYVPRWYLDVNLPKKKGKPRVGWSGSVAVHPDDLCVTGGAIERAVRATGARFRVIGQRTLVAEHLGLSEQPELVPWCAIDQYPFKLARLDVGIVPLTPSDFTEAKSALKMTEMAAVGVPCVGSPTTDNRRVNALGLGRLAATPDEWEAEVTRLVRDTGYRAQVASNSRDAVASHLTIEANCRQWWDAWGQAVENMRAAA